MDYADRLANLCCDVENVIELAAGTGIVSRRLRDKLPPDTQLLVTDLNLPILEVANGKFSEEEIVELTLANAMDLPFGDDIFDLFFCQFGVMLFSDKTASYRETARVLKPDGRYIFNVWSAMSEIPYSELAYMQGCNSFRTIRPVSIESPFTMGP